MPLERRKSDSSDAPAEIAISSEFEVEREGWLSDDRWVEILDHSPGAVVLDRAARGLALLEEHDTRERVGKVEGIRIGEDKVLRGVPRFSRSADGQRAKNDFDDDLLTEVSVGYRILDYKREREKDGVVYYRVTKWEPLEVSLVSVPADPTVGKGRAVAGPTPPTKTTPVEPPAQIRAEGGTMPEQEPVAPVVTRMETPKEDDRVQRLAELAESVNMKDQLGGWLQRRLDDKAIFAEIKAERERQVAAGKDALAKPGADPLDISPKERRRFSIVKCVRAAIDDKPITGYEAEVQQEFNKRGFFPSNGGFLAPSRHGIPGMMQRATGQLDTATSTQGQELVFIEPGSFIELFRNRSALLALGARYLTGLQGNIAFPRQTGAGTATWTGQAPTADVTASNVTFDQLSMSPKTLMSATNVSRQLMTQDASAGVDIESLVRADIAAIHALAIDLAGISGTGASNQPTGILTASNVNSVTLGTHGAAPTYDKLIDMLTELAIDNAPDATGFLTTPGVAAKLKKTQKFASTNGEAVWIGRLRDGQVADGYRAFATNQMPSNLTKGTSTTICHAIVAADFSEIMFGEWGGFEIVVDPYTLLGRNLVRLVSYQTADIGLRHVQSFCKTVDALTA